MCNLSDFMPNKYKIHIQMLEEYKENTLTYITFNYLVNSSKQKYTKMIDDICDHFIRYLHRSVMYINELVEKEEFELCKKIYDLTYYIFEYILKLELNRIDPDIEIIDIDYVDDQFNYIFNQISELNRNN